MNRSNFTCLGTFFFVTSASDLVFLPGLGGETFEDDLGLFKLFFTEFLSSFTLGERLLISFLIVGFFFLGLGNPVRFIFLFFLGLQVFE